MNTSRTILLTAVASRREYQELIPPHAIQVLQEVMEHGAKNRKTDLRTKSVRFHLGRAVVHIEKWLAGDRTERHLRHAFCRLMMAVLADEYPGEDSES